MAINPDDATPIYLQIAQDIRHQILIGTLKEGDRIMSTTEYATTYRINPATAQKAFGLLIDEALVEKRRGIGTFVAAGARERIERAGRASYLEETLAPALESGRALGLSADEILNLARTTLMKEAGK